MTGFAGSGEMRKKADYKSIYQQQEEARKKKKQLEESRAAEQRRNTQSRSGAQGQAIVTADKAAAFADKKKQEKIAKENKQSEMHRSARKTYDMTVNYQKRIKQANDFINGMSDEEYTSALELGQASNPHYGKNLFSKSNEEALNILYGTGDIAYANRVANSILEKQKFDKETKNRAISEKVNLQNYLLQYPEEIAPTESIESLKAKADDAYSRYDELRNFYSAQGTDGMVLAENDDEFLALREEVRDADFAYNHAKNYKLNQDYKAQMKAYTDLTASEDFAQKAAEGKESTDNSLRGKLKGLGQTSTAAIMGGTNDPSTKLQYLSDKEAGIYDYLLATKGKNEAENYLKFMDDELNRRQGKESAKRVLNIDNKALQAIGTTLVGAASGTNQFVSGMKQVGSRITGSDAPVKPSMEQYAGEEVRQNITGAQAIAFDLAQTTSNMLPTMAVSMINPYVGTALMGLSSGGNAYTEARNLGRPDNEAVAYGMLVGTSEALLQRFMGGVVSFAAGGSNVTRAAAQKISTVLSKLAKNPTAQKAIQKILGRAVGSGGEFIEEYMQEVLDPVFRNVVFDQNNEVRLFSSEALYAGLLGALNAGALNAPAYVAEDMASLQGGKVYSDPAALRMLIDYNLQGDKESDAYRIAEQLDKQLAAGGSVSLGQIGALVDSSDETVRYYGAMTNDPEALDVLAEDAITSNSPDSLVYKIAEQIQLMRETGQQVPDELVGMLVDENQKAINDGRAQRLADLKDGKITIDELEPDDLDGLVDPENIEAINRVFGTDIPAGSDSADIYDALDAQNAMVRGESIYGQNESGDGAVSGQLQGQAVPSASEQGGVILGNTGAPEGRKTGQARRASYGLLRTADAKIRTIEVNKKIGSINVPVFQADPNDASPVSREMQAVTQKNADLGYETYFYAGQLKIGNLDIAAKGFRVGKQIFLRVDHRVHFDTINEHELQHGEQNMDRILQDLKGSINETDIEALKKDYASYAPLIDEYEDTKKILYMLEELVADIRADDYNGDLSPEFVDAVRKAIENHGGTAAKGSPDLAASADTDRKVPIFSLEKDITDKDISRMSEPKFKTDEKTYTADLLSYQAENPDQNVYIDGETGAINIRFNAESFDEQDKEMTKNLLMEAGDTDLQASMRINDMFGVRNAIIRDRMRLDFKADRSYSSIKLNSEYGFSADMNSNCVKRLEFQKTIEYLVDNFKNRVLKRNDYIMLRNMMKEAGYKVGCGICFVDSQRMKLGEMTIEFWEKYPETKGKITAWHTLTEEGQAQFKKDDPDLFSKFLRIKGSQNRPKPFEPRTNYRNELIGMFLGHPDKVAQFNANGGFRLLSSSDFEIVHMLDFMQLLTDAQIVRITGQSYTKVPEFVEFAGKTNLMINMSVLARGKGYDANGNLLFDDVEGMPYDTMIRLRNLFPQTAGNILVGANTEHIRLALASPFIDFVIPFHRSGLRIKDYALLQMKGYTDYTNIQNERIIDKETGKPRGLKGAEELALKPKLAEWWDYNKTGDENAQAYLKLCEDRGLIPKFKGEIGNKSEGTHEEVDMTNFKGYWKVLIDFKMFDNDGNAIIQKPIKADFDMNVLERQLGEYDGSHANVKPAVDIADKFMRKYADRTPADQEILDYDTNLNPTENPDIRFSVDTAVALGDQYTATSDVASISKDRLAYLYREYSVPETSTHLDYAQAYLAKIDPKDFLRLTTNHPESIIKEAGDLDVNELRGERQTPFLMVDLNSREVTGHEGRHRMAALMSAGFKRVDIVIIPERDGFDKYNAQKLPPMTLTGQNFYGHKVNGRGLITDVLPLSNRYRAEVKREYIDIPAWLESGKELRFSLDDEAQVYAERRNAIDEIRAAAKTGTVEDVEINNLIKADQQVAKYERELALYDQQQKFKTKEERDAYVASWKKNIAKADADAHKAASVLSAKKAGNEKLQKAINHYRHVIDSAAERRRRSADNQELLKQVRALDQLSKKVLPDMKKRIQELIAEIDKTAVNISDRGMLTLKGINEAYQQAKANDPNFIRQPAVEKKLQRLEQGKRIGEMDVEEVRDLTDVLKNIRHEIRTSRAQIRKGKAIQTYELAIKAIDEMEQAKKLGNSGLKNLYVYESARPETFFAALGGYKKGSVWDGVYEDLAAGQRKGFMFHMQASKKFQSFIDKHKKLIDTWEGKDAEFIDTGIYNGRTESLKITPAQRISLYLHSKNEQNMNHITVGGITAFDRTQYKKGNMAAAFADGTVYKLQRTDVEDIISKMTDVEREFADLAYDFFNADSKNAINETSRALLGYDIATVEHYFPIVTSREYNRAISENLLFDGTIEGAGQLKERQGSVLPINLEDVTGVLLRQIDFVSKYYGLAIPIRNLNNLLSTSEIGLDRTVKKGIASLTKEKGQQYIDNLLKDLQGGRRVQDSFLDKTRGRFAQAILGFNVGSPLKQVASLPLAAATLGWDAISKSAFGKADHALIDKYTALMWLRRQGLSTVELGDVASRRGWASKMPAFMGWIQAMDVAVTGRVWVAAEWYVKKNFPELKAGTDEFYMKVAEWFEKAVEQTQSNYAIMQKPQVLRTDNKLVQQLTMFMTDRLQMFNTLREAHGRLEWAKREYKTNKSTETKEQLREAQRTWSRSVTGSIGSLAWVTAVTMVVNMLLGRRKKYEDEEGNLTAESVIAAGIKEFFGNAAAMVLMGNEIYGAIDSWSQGKQPYDIEAPSLGSINDFIKSVGDTGMALSEFISGIRDVSAEDGSVIEYMDANASDVRKAGLELAKTASVLLGVPAGNIEKYVIGFIKRLSPEFKVAYEDAFNPADIKALKAAGDKEFKATYFRVIQNRMPEVNKFKDVYNEIGSLAMAYRTSEPEMVGKLFAPDPPKKFSDDSVEYILTESEKLNYGKTMRSGLAMALSDLINSDAYEAMDDAHMMKAIGYLIGLQVEDAKAALLKKRGIDMERSDGYYLKKAGIGYDVYAAFKTQDDIFENSDENPLKDQYREYVDGLTDLDSEQREILFMTRYAAMDDLTMGRVVSYIQNLDIPDGEKAALADSINLKTYNGKIYAERKK